MLHVNFEQLKKGCPTAFAELHAQYSSQIFWLGKQMIHDDFVIDTLVQDTFLKLWINRDKMESPKHLYFFLRLVMKRSCISYYTMPRNKFFRRVNSLEGYENYQDYLAGYDPKEDMEHRNAQEQEQERLERVENVLPLLSDESSRLIALCLHYDFAYTAIAKCMGSSVTATRLKINKAIARIKVILNQGDRLELQERAATNGTGALTAQQAEVLRLRCEDNHSFAAIATLLQLTEKEVQRAFVTAYTLLNNIHHQKSA